MEKKRKISQYRERLDKTLASLELTDQETLKTLVWNQLLGSSQNNTEGCSEKLLERRTNEVSNFLDMLRSASVNDHEVSRSGEASHGDWKLKQDDEELRVMYREGPQGTPFHTLLAEGYVDGPVDVCLCISWESALYKKWWPQSTIPAFKIITCKCLQRVRISEQIAQVRMKLSWPLSTREAVVHYFMFEYFKDDLVVVLLSTIPDSGSIEEGTHGFTNDVIPEAQDVVRIDLVGGFAIQKVTPERSYFRTIATMDIKLDFVPPSLINFISRQLIGNGFRLYQKAVVSVSNYDEDYAKALADPLYTKIHEALYSIKEPEEVQEGNELETYACVIPQQELTKDMQDEECESNIEEEFHSDEHTSEASPVNAQATKTKAFDEIQEEESEANTYLEEGFISVDQSSDNKTVAKCHVDGKRSLFISPEVEQALGTLEKVISFVREYGLGSQTKSSSSFSGEEPAILGTDSPKGSTSLEDAGVCSHSKESDEVANEVVERTSHESRNSSGTREVRSTGSNSFLREANHNRIAPASPEKDILVPPETSHITLNSSMNGSMEAAILDQTTHDHKQMSPKGNIHEGTLSGGKKLNKQKTYRFCCFGFNSV